MNRGRGNANLLGIGIGGQNTLDVEHVCQLLLGMARLVWLKEELRLIIGSAAGLDAEIKQFTMRSSQRSDGKTITGKAQSTKI